MEVKDVIAIARKRLGLPVDHEDNESETMDLLAVSEGSSEIIREIQPGVDRRTLELTGGQVEINLPYRSLTVENLYLDGVDLSGFRVSPTQMQTNVESDHVE